MGIEFNRIITLLRKERGITQKQAAQDLGISQAQLSHYEKGIRECGLAFVVQVADYYDVSCDYLLGRSAERSGQTITVEELPEGNSATGGSVYRGSVLPTMYKKLIENSLDILYDKLQESRDKQLVVGVSSYLMLAVYKMFRLLYEASPKNVSGMFRVGSARWDRSADAAMSMAEGDLAAALTGCANLKVGLMLLQHATGPYDPMDQVMEDRLNAILEAAVAQDAAAIKAQFAPNAIAAQPELDSQIEALLAYYNNETWEFEIPATGISESRNETGGTTRSYEMHSRIDGEKYYLVSMHAVVNDTTEPDNVGIWSLFLFRTDYPIESAYYVKDEDNMVGIYVDLLPRHMQY